jgi:hypothetical protein
VTNSSLLRILVGLLTAVAVYYALALVVLVIGGTECDRGDCNFVGDAAADGAGPWVFGLGALAVALGVGLVAARRVP